ncbi:hypothetical protein AB0M39_11675 [Streptomyces sp. NPDC051907]|uniref:hypothetical protein n=1 Tax=Streptomyces sp. NPDC051907 TaxID=3155284 RepID=UPI0034192D10
MSSKKRLLKKSLSSTGIGLAALVLSVTALGGQASADVIEGVEVDDSIVSEHAEGITAGLPCINSTGVKTCFDKAGDKVYVKDTLADHKSAVGLWQTNYGRTGGCRNKHEAGTWAKCNYDMREEGHIQLQNARYDGETNRFTCPNPRVYSVWLPIG